MNDAPNRYLAQASGCVVVAAAYHLAPEFPYPAGLEDCHAVLRWMRAESLSVDSRQTELQSQAKAEAAHLRQDSRSMFATKATCPYPPSS